jgi:transcriptional regulator with XRE-family HTH domain
MAYLDGMTTITEQLRASIRKSGLLQEQIAEATGVSQGVLSRFIRGERSINLTTAEKLAEYFELELCERPRARKKS